MLLGPITVRALPITPPDHCRLLLRSWLCCSGKVGSNPPAQGHSIARTQPATAQVLDELHPEPCLFPAEAAPYAWDAPC